MKREFRAHLRETVLARRYLALFDGARMREPALAEHLSIVNVLAVLADAGDERYAERDALALALIREQQRAPSPLWTSALLIAFTPMLLRLRGRISGNPTTRDELDLLVVEVFLDVVQQYPTVRAPGRTALYLRQESQRAAFRLLNRERARTDANAELAPEISELRTLAEFVASETTPESEAEDREEMRQLLRECAALATSPERLAVIEATCIGGETLCEHVARTRPDLTGPALRVEYERIKRERHRTIAKLRPLFGAPHGDDERDAPPESTRLRATARRARRPQPSA